MYDLTGQVFAQWLVVRENGRSSRGEKMWWCRCECGNEKSVASSILRGGKSKSCGCYRVERGREHGAVINLKHGEAGNGKESVEYRTWSSMIARCYSPTHASYTHYHARGITVCDRWRNSFEHFLADMGRKPSPELSIDRIDNKKGYEAGNCHWATSEEQNENRDVRKEGRGRPPEIATIGGVTRSVRDWLREIGISYFGLRRRLKQGMTLEAALTLPRQKSGRKPSKH